MNEQHHEEMGRILTETRANEKMKLDQEITQLKQTNARILGDAKVATKQELRTAHKVEMERLQVRRERRGEREEERASTRKKRREEKEEERKQKREN